LALGQVPSRTEPEPQSFPKPRTLLPGTPAVHGPQPRRANKQTIKNKSAGTETAEFAGKVTTKLEYTKRNAEVYFLRFQAFSKSFRYTKNNNHNSLSHSENAN